MVGQVETIQPEETQTCRAIPAVLLGIRFRFENFNIAPGDARTRSVGLAKEEPFKRCLQHHALHVGSSRKVISTSSSSPAPGPQARWQAADTVAKKAPPPKTPPCYGRDGAPRSGFDGFLNRKHDGFPGSKTLRIGLQCVQDFALALTAQHASQRQRLMCNEMGLTCPKCRQYCSQRPRLGKPTDNRRITSGANRNAKDQSYFGRYCHVVSRGLCGTTTSGRQ